jgi:hypothetical protein
MRTSTCLGLSFLVALTAACATSVAPPAEEIPPEEGAATPSEGNKIPGEPPAAPHALGQVVLGETRSAADGNSTPVISATFLPDAKLAAKCTKTVGACEITQIPKCMTGATTGCATGETCTFDDGCSPKCVKPCTKSCGAGEECVFSNTAAAVDAGMICQKSDRFDAGAISFDGTTSAVTLFPPYSVKPVGNGAPFLARSEIRVQATGGTKAGFEKFDERFTATTFMETSPSLAEISRGDVFGTSGVPVSWRPGEDSVIVSAAGPAGTASCTVDDKLGTFEIPRDVLREVIGSEATTPSLTLSVTRERREVKKDKKAFGNLAGGRSVQPQGWLELITRSSESFSYASCATTQTLCGDTCTTTTSDAKNCGTCGNACVTGQYCSAGVCR